MVTMSEQEKKLIHLTIDGKEIAVPKGTTVFNAARQLEIDIPIFCYMDRMPPFGACRVCLVEVEKMGKPQASCTLEATEGMVVTTDSAMATKEREQILELLLINHPLDCPICDRGGECPLQEHTLRYGPGKSRFYEEKRHFEKPLFLGPLLTLDRERCIACARCTRFSDIIAGDHALEFIDRGYKTEVGTPGKGPVESKFIGNTIMICPVGALTSNVYRFRARPWDNEPKESCCTLCPIGCSLILDARDGEIMRTRCKENRDVNDVWLCDKGWFGYEFANHPNRLKEPLVRRDGRLTPTSWEEALAIVAENITNAKATGRLAAWGGNPLTVEENFLLQQLMRKGAGVNHVDHRVGMALFSREEEGAAPQMEISLGECEELSFALLLGIDLTEEFPVLWLRLKQAINRGASVAFFGHFAPEIAKHLEKVVLHPPGGELQALEQALPYLKELAHKGGKGALFVGRQYLLTEQRKAIVSQLIRVRKALPHVTLNILEGHGNSMGARLAGMRPDIGPLERILDTPGLDIMQLLNTASATGWDFLYVVGANPVVHIPQKLWHQVRAKLGLLVVQDLFLTETAQQADLVLPALSFVEKSGHFINIEGRIQRLQPGKERPHGLYSDAEIFDQIAKKLDISLSLDADLLQKLQQYKRLPLAYTSSPNDEGCAQDQRASSNGANLAATFAPALFDRGVRMQHNKQLIQLVKEPTVRLQRQEAINRGLSDGERVHLYANECTISAKVTYDDRVANGTLVIPLGFALLPTYEFGVNLMNGLPVAISKEK